MQNSQPFILRKSPFIIAGFITLLMGSFANAQIGLKEKIQEVETGLLPAIIVEGEALPPASIIERMKYYKVPGLSIAVIKDGKIEWAKGYGVASQEGAKPVDENTMFQAASISKPVAALAALHWVEKGKLTLDNNINGYLKDWQVPDNKFTTVEKVTLRRLVTHTAGLTVHGFRGYAKGEAVPTVVQVLNGEKPANSGAILPDTLPGKIWRYSGGGYTVMQKALADQVGKPFPVIMQETVLSKLGMQHSSYEQPLSTQFSAFSSTGYRANGKAVKGEWHTYPEMAAAGLWTTPSDLARYIIEVQESLQDKSNKVISKSMTEQMLTKHLDRWGLGPGLQNSGDSLIFNHGGANEGFRCVFMAQAYHGNGIVIMTNSDNGSAIANELVRGISKIYGWNFGKSKQIKKFSLTSEQVSSILGKYKMQNYVFELTQANGKLYAKPQWEDETLEIIPENTKKFFTRDGQFWLEFQYEGDTKVKGIKLNGQELFEKVQ
ncbi:serine hydrolase domain-containing protein [Runella sp.]|uniref:serine hydrolase domain-containing protein n=1 Tax=Runella sp. TaxID=1960881 RepID=UPI003D132B96